MKQHKLQEISYDLESMTPAEESQFWSEFEMMLQHSRDSGFSGPTKTTDSFFITDTTPDSLFTLH